MLSVLLSTPDRSPMELLTVSLLFCPVVQSDSCMFHAMDHLGSLFTCRAETLPYMCLLPGHNTLGRINCAIRLGPALAWPVSVSGLIRLPIVLSGCEAGERRAACLAQSRHVNSRLWNFISLQSRDVFPSTYDQASPRPLLNFRRPAVITTDTRSSTSVSPQIPRVGTGGTQGKGKHNVRKRRSSKSRQARRYAYFIVRVTMRKPNSII